MDDILKKLSEKHDIPVYALKVIIESPFRLISDEMENTTLKNFSLPYLGKLVITPGKKNWVQENILNKDEQDTGDISGLEELNIQE